MKKLFLSVVALCVTLFVQAKDYADYVSPLVGTQSSFELSTGNTYPAISRPWGMNFWTPQTGRWGTDGSMFIRLINPWFQNKTHQPSPWINDYGQIFRTRSFPAWRASCWDAGCWPILLWLGKYANGTVFSPDELYEKVKALHARLLQYYESHLQGEAQLLSKMKPYWEYLLPDADRKIKKAIKKATTMDKYLTAVNQL